MLKVRGRVATSMTTDDASAALSELRYTAFLVGTYAADGGSPPPPHFMFANWGTQASFEPWRFVVAIKTKAHTLANIRAGGAFTLNLVDRGSGTLAREVMKKKGDGLAAEDGPSSAPRLVGAYAGFDCRLVEVHDIGGDHALVVGEVVDGWKKGAGPALTLPELDLSYSG